MPLWPPDLTGGFLAIGEPVIGGTPGDFLKVAPDGTLAQAAFIPSMAIGEPVVGGTPTAVLFVADDGSLGQDPDFFEYRHGPQAQLFLRPGPFPEPSNHPGFEVLSNELCFSSETTHQQMFRLDTPEGSPALVTNNRIKTKVDQIVFSDGTVGPLMGQMVGSAFGQPMFVWNDHFETLIDPATIPAGLPAVGFRQLAPGGESQVMIQNTATTSTANLARLYLNPLGGLSTVDAPYIQGRGEAGNFSVAFDFFTQTGAGAPIKALTLGKNQGAHFTGAAVVGGDGLKSAADANLTLVPEAGQTAELLDMSAASATLPMMKLRVTTDVPAITPSVFFKVLDETNTAYYVPGYALGA